MKNDNPEFKKNAQLPGNPKSHFRIPQSPRHFAFRIPHFSFIVNP